MEFMILRRANQNTERGQQPPALEPGTFLRPSAEAVRLVRRDGAWSQSQGPFSPRELVAGFTLLEAESREDAIEQVRWFPLFDSGAVYEIRDPGCPGGCVGFDDRGTANAARVHFANSKTTVIDGPFTEVKELIAGYWMLQAASIDDAIAWAKAYPYPTPDDLTLEIREACERIAHQEFTPEMRAAEERLRAELLEVGLRDAFSKKSRARQG